MPQDPARNLGVASSTCVSHLPGTDCSRGPPSSAYHDYESACLGSRVLLDESNNWFDWAAGRILSCEDLQRVQSLGAGLRSDLRTNRALSLKAVRRSLAVLKLLYQYYFRVESSGHEFLPEKGGAIVAANHGGLLPFDGAMAIVDVFLKMKPPRLMRAMVDRWAETLPFVGQFYAQTGQVVATRDNLRMLLEDEQIVLLFPEGIAAMQKRAAQRYVLRGFRYGLVEASLRLRVPIVPMAIVGPDDQAPVLYDSKILAKALHLPIFPVTPTFPLLGLAGLLPYPVTYEIEYGAPFRLYEEYPARLHRDTTALSRMAEDVRQRIQRMVDRRLANRWGRRS